MEMHDTYHRVIRENRDFREGQYLKQRDDDADTNVASCIASAEQERTAYQVQVEEAANDIDNYASSILAAGSPQSARRVLQCHHGHH